MKNIPENKVSNVLIILLLLIHTQLAYGESESELINQAYQSTYKPDTSPRILIKNATILTGTGELLENSSILIDSNRIISIGNDDTNNAEIIDAKGKWITPGIIDIHSHMGVYPAPSLRGNSDGNEATNPVTPHVWAEHSVWTQDPQFTLALKGGITTFR